MLGFLRFRFPLRFLFLKTVLFLQSSGKFCFEKLCVKSSRAFRAAYNGKGFSKRSRLFPFAIEFSLLPKRTKKGGLHRPFRFLSKSVFKTPCNHSQAFIGFSEKC